MAFATAPTADSLLFVLRAPRTAEDAIGTLVFEGKDGDAIAAIGLPPTIATIATFCSGKQI